MIDLLLQLNKPIPRYTSYPTAPEWETISSSLYESTLTALGQKESPLAIYVHIPFCHSMCLFCGCSVILNRNPENEEKYVNYLCKEIDLVSQRLEKRKSICQLHFGGGTPTKLSKQEFEKLFFKIAASFPLEAGAEIAIEVDPRTVVEDGGAKLQWLKKLGFNRISFGVQDTNERVQEAVRRRQSAEVTIKTYSMARSLGFQGINIDLIYGLPYQTCQTFEETINTIIALRPDRIALFSYAKIPWLKLHQKAIKDETLPPTQEKFMMYLGAREKLLAAGYKVIGMDHFALPEDELSKAYEAKTLRRNFQGYTVLPVDDLIGLGVTAVGSIGDSYFQNVKELSTYYESIDQGSLASFRGKVLSDDDRRRKWVIQRLMCDFFVNKAQFFERFGLSFDFYFVQERERLKECMQVGLVEDDEESVRATKQGRLFIRNISACFDYYLAKKEGAMRFSQAV